MSFDDFYEWLNYGMDKKYISKMYCSTHDILDEDIEEVDEDMDICIPVVKVYGTSIVYDE